MTSRMNSTRITPTKLPPNPNAPDMRMPPLKGISGAGFLYVVLFSAPGILYCMKKGKSGLDIRPRRGDLGIRYRGNDPGTGCPYARQVWGKSGPAAHARATAEKRGLDR